MQATFGNMVTIAGGVFSIAEELERLMWSVYQVFTSNVREWNA